MPTLTDAFRGNRLVARVLRSASWLVIGYGASQALRLASNLILTRLLFPEAFGLMALVTVVTVGLQMFSDVGISAAIAQNNRGDDPDFLNTAWTVQVIRGFILWGAACLLAWPVSLLYDAPDLVLYLPIAGISLALAGFNPTRIQTGYRHLLVGRQTSLDLLSQLIGILSMIALAAITQSVMSLVAGVVIGALAKLVLMHMFLPGPVNQFRWERSAVRYLIGFGKWILLSTAFWFLSSQGDKAILGKFLTLDALGIYNIGYFLASFPLLLGHTVTQKVLIPVYREKPPGEARENAVKLRQMRAGFSLAIVGGLILMALIGPWLVGFLYDDRYAQAGAMVVVISCVLVPQAIGTTYPPVALSAGDSKRFFVFSSCRGALQVGFLLIGVVQFGLLGALLAMGVALTLVHPVAIWLARAHDAWDPLHDILASLVAGALIALAFWLHWEAISALAAL